MIASELYCFKKLLILWDKVGYERIFAICIKEKLPFSLGFIKNKNFFSYFALIYFLWNKIIQPF